MDWARLKAKGLASRWAPASQDSSHVGNAGVGVVSMRCAPVALPTFATAQFQRFFERGRARTWWFEMVIKVLTVSDPEQLAFTEQLFDAAVGELGVVARGQPSFDFW